MLRVLHHRSGVMDESLLEAAFEMRARVMHDQMGWRFPEQNAKRDSDDFDTDKTLHFISANDQGQVIAYGRLNPTMEPHMFSEHFEEYCTFDGLIRSPRVFEHSRYMVDKKAVSKEAWKRHRGAVEVGIATLCAEAGLEAITWLSNISAYTHVVKITKGTRPLGSPIWCENENCDYVAAISDSIPEVVPWMAAYYGFDQVIVDQFQDEVARVVSSVRGMVASYEQANAA